MKVCIWCGDDFDDEDAQQNEFDPYCNSLCAAQAQEDSEEDEGEDNE